MMTTYRSAGVDIDVGDAFVEAIRPLAEGTYRPEVLGGIGGFAAHFALDLQRFSEPVLVSCTDGVGTKLRVALECNRLEGIGIDCVAMCVNDLVCSGAEPLFFLDYFAAGKLDPPRHRTIIAGIATACRQVGCALIGGETAEMPGLYRGADFDLAGFAVGIVERAALIDGRTIQPGHALIGIGSSGFHSNGYALLRTICADHHLAWDATLPGTPDRLGAYLLRPTHLYPILVRRLHARYRLGGVAHITGGGLPGNLPRILPTDCQARIDWTHWSMPEPMQYLADLGGVSLDEARTVFNCGIGCVLVSAADQAEAIVQECAAAGHVARPIGVVTRRAEADPAILFT